MQFKGNDAVIPDETQVVTQGPPSQLFAHQEDRHGILHARPVRTVSTSLSNDTFIILCSAKLTKWKQRLCAMNLEANYYP